MTRDRIVGIVVVVWALGAIGWAAWRAQQGTTANNEPIVMPASKSDAGVRFPAKPPQQPPPVFLPASKSDAGAGVRTRDKAGESVQPAVDAELGTELQDAIFFNGSKSKMPAGGADPFLGTPDNAAPDAP